MCVPAKKLNITTLINNIRGYQGSGRLTRQVLKSIDVDIIISGLFISVIAI